MARRPDDREDNHTEDPSQPLLPDPWLRKRKVHVLLLIKLVLVLLGVLALCIWLFLGNASNSGGTTPDTPFELVNRTAWGARLATDTSPLPTRPATRVVIIHTVSQPCLDLDGCSQQVRQIQAEHIDHFNFGDISYNFLIGGDGRTYEGRGWDTKGAFATLLNSKALGIAFIGDFEYTAPPPKQVAEARALLEESVKRNKLAADYKLVGHRQVALTLSPGQKLFDIINHWPHWEVCNMHSC